MFLRQVRPQRLAHGIFSRSIRSGLVSMQRRPNFTPQLLSRASSSQQGDPQQRDPPPDVWAAIGETPEAYDQADDDRKMEIEIKHATFRMEYYYKDRRIIVDEENKPEIYRSGMMWLPVKVPDAQIVLWRIEQEVSEADWKPTIIYLYVHATDDDAPYLTYDTLTRILSETAQRVEEKGHFVDGGKAIMIWQYGLKISFFWRHGDRKISNATA
ncbi:hypothetical protein ACLMJK_007829 [Lecanora helva]